MNSEWKPKVVSLDGVPHTTNLPPEVNAQLVADLEDMLARARSGQITGYAYVQHNADGTVQHYWAGAVSSCYSIIGALEVLQQQLTARFFNDEG